MKSSSLEQHSINNFSIRNSSLALGTFSEIGLSGLITSNPITASVCASLIIEVLHINMLKETIIVKKDNNIYIKI